MCDRGTHLKARGGATHGGGTAHASGARVCPGYGEVRSRVWRLPRRSVEDAQRPGHSRGVSLDFPSSKNVIQCLSADTCPTDLDHFRTTPRANGPLPVSTGTGIGRGGACTARAAGVNPRGRNCPPRAAAVNASSA